ncbi:MAG TPA: helix-turn-helix domain-containing protein [Candidatus Micrarchaeaceae archaeon]|nr:helix-turn-helix domain-containing protein [Candidatus Micrarchaeaceae archaeon]
MPYTFGNYLQVKGSLLIASGQLASFHIGRCRRIRRVDLEEYLARQVAAEVELVQVEALPVEALRILRSSLRLLGLRARLGDEQLRAGQQGDLKQRSRELAQGTRPELPAVSGPRDCEGGHARNFSQPTLSHASNGKLVGEAIRIDRDYS